MKKICHIFLFFILSLNTLSVSASEQLLESVVSKVFPEKQMNRSLEKISEFLSFVEISKYHIDETTLSKEINLRKKELKTKLSTNFTDNELKELLTLLESKNIENLFHSILGGDIFDSFSMNAFEGIQNWIETQKFPNLEYKPLISQEVETFLKKFNILQLVNQINFYEAICPIVEDKSKLPCETETNNSFRKYCQDIFLDIICKNTDTNTIEELDSLINRSIINKLITICL